MEMDVYSVTCLPIPESSKHNGGPYLLGKAGQPNVCNLEHEGKRYASFFLCVTGIFITFANQ